MLAFINSYRQPLTSVNHSAEEQQDIEHITDRFLYISTGIGILQTQVSQSQSCIDSPVDGSHRRIHRSKSGIRGNSICYQITPTRSLLAGLGKNLLCIIKGLDCSFSLTVASISIGHCSLHCSIYHRWHIKRLFHGIDNTHSFHSLNAFGIQGT